MDIPEDVAAALTALAEQEHGALYEEMAARGRQLRGVPTEELLEKLRESLAVSGAYTVVALGRLSRRSPSESVVAGTLEALQQLVAVWHTLELMRSVGRTD